LDTPAASAISAMVGRFTSTSDVRNRQLNRSSEILIGA
jgi:hypothetical protein